MSGWTLIETHPTHGRTFQRPLSAVEQGFFWDGQVDGTTDSVHHFEIHLSNGTQDAHLFSEANIRRAWLSTKRQHPLAGAIVQVEGLDVSTDPKSGEGAMDNDGKRFTSKPRFIVQELNLSVLRPLEIIFGRVANAEEARRRAITVLDNPRPLSKDLLAQLSVFREANSEEAHADVLHVMLLVAHCVADWMADWMLMRCFLDTLARGGGPGPAQIPLEDRLAMVIPVEQLEPRSLRSLSPARRRWRMVVGAIIVQLRMERAKGGHTLPCRLTRSTPHTVARHRLIITSLAHAESATVVANCRRYNFTFGNAYLVLSQVAMTRVLYRRYLRGEISEEEWEYRKRQPYISGWLLNLRPYLNETWFERGGGGEFMQSAGACTYQLPFMTLGGIGRLPREQKERHASPDDAPSFLDLLAFDRFLHRAALVKKQAAAFFNHPLLFEMAHAENVRFGRFQRQGALQRMRHMESGPNRSGGQDEDEVVAVTDIPVVRSLIWSSIGNMDTIFPREYPLPPTHVLSPYSPVSHPTKAGYVIPSVPSLPVAPDVNMVSPKIIVEYARTHLHVRPGELYLGAGTTRGQMDMSVFYDSNVFEETVVKEWLDEVKEAVLWYLGRVGHGDGQAERGQGFHSKL